MTLWVGVGGSYIECDSFSSDQRNRSLSLCETQRICWRLWQLSPFFTLWSAALFSQVCKYMMGRSTHYYSREEKRQFVLRERTKKKKTQKLIFSHGCFISASVNSWLRWKELSADHCLLVSVLIWPLGGAKVSQWNGGILSKVLKSHQNIFPSKFPATPPLNTWNFRETT